MHPLSSVFKVAAIAVVLIVSSQVAHAEPKNEASPGSSSWSGDTPGEYRLFAYVDYHLFSSQQRHRSRYGNYVRAKEHASWFSKLSVGWHHKIADVYWLGASIRSRDVELRATEPHDGRCGSKCRSSPRYQILSYAPSFIVDLYQSVAVTIAARADIGFARVTTTDIGSDSKRASPLRLTAAAEFLAIIGDGLGSELVVNTGYSYLPLNGANLGAFNIGIGWALLL